MELQEGTVVVIHAFDDVPEHLFRVAEVHDDCITGYALTGPGKGDVAVRVFFLKLFPGS